MIIEVDLLLRRKAMASINGTLTEVSDTITAELHRTDLEIPRDIRSGEYFRLPAIRNHKTSDWLTWSEDCWWLWNAGEGEWTCHALTIDFKDNRDGFVEFGRHAMEHGWNLNNLLNGHELPIQNEYWPGK